MNFDSFIFTWIEYQDLLKLLSYLLWLWCGLAVGQSALLLSPVQHIVLALSLFLHILHDAVPPSSRSSPSSPNSCNRHILSDTFPHLTSHNASELSQPPDLPRDCIQPGTFQSARAEYTSERAPSVSCALRQRRREGSLATPMRCKCVCK